MIEKTVDFYGELDSMRNELRETHRAAVSDAHEEGYSVGFEQGRQDGLEEGRREPFRDTHPEHAARCEHALLYGCSSLSDEADKRRAIEAVSGLLQQQGLHTIAEELERIVL